jgi:hypothetical protein
LQQHWKHNLFRSGGLLANGGRHSILSSDGRKQLTEPPDCLLLHHFMFRNRDETTRKHKLLCEPQGDGDDFRYAPEARNINVGATLRLRNLDAIYEGRWAEVELPHSQGLLVRKGFDLVDFAATEYAKSHPLRLWGTPPESPASAGPAVVLVHYKMPADRLLQHFQWNDQQYRQTTATVYVVTDRHICLPDYARVLIYPEAMSEFSLAKTSNYGIRTAIDNHHSQIVKTDSDVCFNDLITVLAVGRFDAHAPRYSSVACYETRHISQGIMPDGYGTVAMTATNWLRVQGYHEEMSGWGYEDEELVAHCREISINVDTSGCVIHVGHDNTAKWNPSFNPNRRQANVATAEYRAFQPDWGRCNG